MAQEQTNEENKHRTCPGCSEAQTEAALFCEKCGEPLFEGKEAGIYEIVERIGEGGMGVVYKALHKKLGTPFALKMLHKQFARNKDLVTRFVNEAKATSRLRHEHIVFITDFGELERLGPYIAMEYLEGATLKSVLEPGDPLPLDRIFTIAIQLADTMAYAHGQGLVHRDLKPDNIFLIHRENPHQDYIKLLDFGIVKVFAEGEDASLTRTGAVLGTPIYMAPEQALSKGLDHRADIYSFGVILFEMVTGFLPFQGTTAFELIEQRLFNPAPPISTYAPQWAGSTMEILVELCLMREPAERIQSMKEIKQKLERIRERHQLRITSAALSEASQSVAETQDLDAEDTAPDEASNVSSDEASAPSKAPSPMDTRLQETGAYAPPGQLPTGTMLGELERQAEPSTPHPAGPPADIALTYDIAPGSGRGRWIAAALVLCLIGAGVAYSFFGARRGARNTPQARDVRPIAMGKALLRTPGTTPSQRIPDAAKAAPTPDAAPRQPRVIARAPVVRVRRRTRRRWRRRRRRRVARSPVQRRVTPRPRPVVPRPRPRPAVSRFGANGCLRRTEKVNTIRMRANDNQIKVAVSRSLGSWGSRRVPHAKDGVGWCLRVPRGGVYVRAFGAHRELADCWFKLSYYFKPSFKITLRNLEDGGPGRYCQPR